MKILNVVNIFFTIPYFLGDQLKHFTNKGHEIHLVCSPSSQLRDYANLQGCRSKEILITRQFSVFKDFQSLWKLINYIKHNKFDIVCGHTPKAGMLAMIAAYLLGVKKRIYYRHGLVYETSHGLKKKIFIMCEKLASRCSTKVVCVSPYLFERSLLDNLTKKDKLIVLGKGSSAGVDTRERFNPHNIDIEKKNSVRDGLHIPADAFVVGFVGRMVNDKGINELVAAFDLLKSKYTNLHLLLVGPMEVRDGLSIAIREQIQNDPKIHYAGLVSENIEYLYSIMDILVLPTHREGLGMVLIEAESMGIPVLAPSHTGSRDALIDGETGFYIELNPKSIMDKVEGYLENKVFLKEHGKNARKFAQTQFDQKLIWSEFENKILN